MEIQFFGANCVKITSKKFTIIVDDNLSELGLKKITKPTDLSLRTSIEIPEHRDAKFTAELPGEYEVSGAIIRGIAARSHMDQDNQNNAVMYTIESEDSRIAVLGHIFPDLSDNQLEQIGMVDVLITPVGGHGYTLDGVGALSIIKKIEPKIVIPTHYADKAIKYAVPQAERSEAVKSMGMEPVETTDKYKLKPMEPGDATRLIILERQ